MPRADWLLAGLVAGLTLATRLPFRARVLPTWDAVQFALALGDYDIVKHQPHPPGYVLYVAAARVLQAIVGDAALALTWLAMGASALTVLLVYRLARGLYDRPTALVAGSALAASPLFWFYGVVGLSYTAEAALATLVAGLAWGMRRGRLPALVGSALALGLAGGVRQSIPLLLGPLWLGLAWAGCRRWRPVLGGAALIALASAAWLVPMVALAGGPRRYLAAALELYASTVRATTVFGSHGGHWVVNVAGLGEAFLLGLGVLLPVLLWLLLEAGRRAPAWGPRAWLFAGWILPALALYTFVHLGQHGYLLTVLPAVYLLVARRLVVAWGPPGGARRRRGPLVAAVLAGTLLTHATFFAAAGPVDVAFPPDGAPWAERWTARLQAFYRFRLWASTAAGLREREDVIATYVLAVRRDFDPADTVLVTELGNVRSYPWFRHAMYYLPEFTVYHLRLGEDAPTYLTSQPGGVSTAVGEARIVLPARTRRIVWMVDYWNPAVARPQALEARPLPHGRWLYVLPVAREPVEHAGYRLTPITALARLR